MAKMNRVGKVLVFLALASLLGLACFGAMAESVQTITEHVWDNGTFYKAATCAEGEIWEYHCTIVGCGATKRVEVGPTNPNAHQWGEWKDTKLPTCTEPGSQTRTCNLVNHHTETRSVPALGHSWGDWEERKAPTCTEPGEKIHYCTRDKSHYEVQAINPTGHDWGPWTDIDVVTCTTGGRQRRVCRNDSSHIETRTVEPTGHTFGPWTVVIKATCEAKGLEERVCSKCGLLEQREIPALGHKWDKGVIVKKPTMTEEGLKEYTCQNDSSHKKYEKLGVTVMSNNTMCAFGPRLRESNLYPYNSDRWYMYTPFDASQEGTQTFELVASDSVIPGSIQISVRDGYLTVHEPQIIGNTLTYDLKFFTVLHKISDLTMYEPEQLLSLNMVFDQPMNIQELFGEDRNLVLYLCCRVTYTYNQRWDFLQYNSAAHQRILDNMKWLMSVDMF